MKQHFDDELLQAFMNGFYGFSYLPDWQAIAGGALQRAHTGNMHMHQSTECLSIVLEHPVAFGVTNAYFHEAGEYIRSALAEQPQR